MSDYIFFNFIIHLLHFFTDIYTTTTYLFLLYLHMIMSVFFIVSSKHIDKDYGVKKVLMLKNTHYLLELHH